MGIVFRKRKTRILLTLMVENGFILVDGKTIERGRVDGRSRYHSIPKTIYTGLPSEAKQNALGACATHFPQRRDRRGVSSGVPMGSMPTVESEIGIRHKGQMVLSLSFDKSQLPANEIL